MAGVALWFTNPVLMLPICGLVDSMSMYSSLQLPASGPSQPPAASSTQEGCPSPPGQTSKGSLDTMLGLLQSDLSRRGVPTQAKGLCGSCNKPIAGQVSAALRKEAYAHIATFENQTLCFSLHKYCLFFENLMHAYSIFWFCLIPVLIPSSTPTSCHIFKITKYS